MEYGYRLVKCPWCDHAFMWNKTGWESSLLPKNRLKDTKEYVSDTKCPKCGERLLVLPGVLVGAFMDDARVEPV